MAELSGDLSLLSDSASPPTIQRASIEPIGPESTLEPITIEPESPLPPTDQDDGQTFRAIAFHDVRENVRASPSLKRAPKPTIVDERTTATSVRDRGRTRFDVRPTIRVPLSKLPWLGVTSSASWRSRDRSGSRRPPRRPLTRGSTGGSGWTG